MLNGLGQTSVPTTITVTPENTGLLQPSATDIQLATSAGYTPGEWMNLTPEEQTAALQQAQTIPVQNTGGTSTGGGLLDFLFGSTGGQPLITFGAGAQPSAGQVQQAIAAGYTPTAWAQMTPAQRQAALTAAGVASPSSMMPILLIGGGLLLVLMLSKKGR